MRPGRRVARLEGRGGVLPPEVCAYAAHLAAEQGLDAAEVLAEARAVLAGAAAAGATSAPRLAAWLAEQDGGDPAALLAEAGAAVAGWRAGAGR